MKIEGIFAARAAYRAYYEQKVGPTWNEPELDHELMVELMTDLIHLAHDQDWEIPVEGTVRRALEHFEEETGRRDHPLC